MSASPARVVAHRVLRRVADEDAYADRAFRAEADRARLDPSAPPEALERRVRALTPHVGAFVELAGGERLGVRRVSVGDPHEAPSPGELVARDGRLLFGAAGGALELLTVQPAGGRPMDAGAFLRGHASQLL